MDTGTYKDGIGEENIWTIDKPDYTKLSIEGDFIFFKPDYSIKFIFNKDNGKEIGCLDFNGDKLKFEGDMEESAKIFIEFILNTFNQKIEEIKAEAWNNGYKEGKED